MKKKLSGKQMNNRVNIDTGIFTLHFTKNEPKEVKVLMEKIRTNEIETHVVAPVFIEVYYQIAKLPGGTEFAENSIVELFKKYSLKIIQLDPSLIIKAGLIKSQN